jgi:hypothetical protein
LLFDQNEGSLWLELPSCRINSVFSSSLSVSESHLLPSESPGLETGELNVEHSEEYRLPEDGEDMLGIDAVHLYVTGD